MDRKIPAHEVIEQLGRGGESNLGGENSGMSSDTSQHHLFSGAGIMEGPSDNGIKYAGNQQRRTSMGFGNDGRGGTAFQRLDQNRRSSLDKAQEFQQQYAKDSLTDTFKSWFRS
jgi:hypothetical protein